MPAIIISAYEGHNLQGYEDLTYCVPVTDSKVYVTVSGGAYVVVGTTLSLAVDMLGRDTVELAASSVEMAMMVTVSVTSMVEVSSMMTLVPYRSCQLLIYALVSGYL